MPTDLVNSELVKYAAPIISSIIGVLLPFSTRPKLTKYHRAAVALIIFVAVFLLWPSNCKSLPYYIIWIVAFLIGSVLAHIWDTHVSNKYQYSQVSLEGDIRVVNVVLGGPELTESANKLKKDRPDLSEQQIFEQLEYDPARTWQRGPWARIQTAHHLAAVTKVCALVVAVVMVLGCILLNLDTQIKHRPLSLSASIKGPVLEERHDQITATLVECDPTVKWKLDGPDHHNWGKLKNGEYWAPEKIERAFEVVVTATPLEHPNESQKITIQLGAYPEGSLPVRTGGEDTQHNKARFEINVLDKKYSWQIGHYILDGADGQVFARHMRDKGLFNGLKAIICIGASSREYINNDKSQENIRAQKRAAVLGGWVQAAIRPENRTPIHTLSVGRYQAEGEGTAAERRVVIVGVLEADKNVNLREALFDAFTKKRSEERLLGEYLDKYPLEQWQLGELPNEPATEGSGGQQ